jgi:hypothetical protein
MKNNIKLKYIIEFKILKIIAFVNELCFFYSITKG